MTKWSTSGTLALAALSLGFGTSALAQSESGFMLFDSASSTIEVLGATEGSSASGYTIECRIFLTGSQSDAAGRFPATIFFEHQAGVKHRWLGFSAGFPTGFLASATDSWYEGQWILSPSMLASASWHHLAYVVRPGEESIYVDGSRVSMRVRGSATPISGAGSSHIGAGYQADAVRVTPSFSGYLDWMRVSSTARYTGTQFDVPQESQLSSDAATELLCTFNGRNATECLRDLSSHQFVLQGGTGVPGGTAPKLTRDCNGDDIPDTWQLTAGTLADDNANGVPDVCETSITGVSPPSVPAQGGTLVTIKGNNFPENPAVSIGGLVASEVIRLSPIRITARTPSLLPGMASVSVNGFTLPDAVYVRPECGSDLDQDGAVSGGDLAILLLDWGPCVQSFQSNDLGNPPSLLEEGAQGTPSAR